MIQGEVRPVSGELGNAIDDIVKERAVEAMEFQDIRKERRVHSLLQQF